MKSKFLNISIGVTLMLFGAGFLVRSITNANAAPSPNDFIAEGTNSIGKYHMQIYNNSGDNNRRCVLVWDTETGKSQGYYQVGREWETEKMLPEKPLGE